MQGNHSLLRASPVSRSVPLSSASAITNIGRFALLLVFVLTACVLSSGMDDAATLTTAPAVVINPVVGPPTTNLLVSGNGFDPYAAVDIYFDVTDLALATTNGVGAFGGGSLHSGIAIQVPASAVPGTHWITAVERFGQKAAQTTFLVRTDWAQFNFEPSHKGLNPYENVLSPSTVGSIDLHWSYQTGYFIGSSPVVGNGAVYFQSGDGNLYVLNASSGQLLWQYPTGPTSSAAAVVSGVLYTGGYDLYAFNASTGAVLWQYPIGGSSSSPTVANGVVYVGSLLDYSLYAINANNGQFLWRYTTGSYIVSSPAVANGVVYVGSQDKKIYALNASTGALLWQRTTGGAVESSPAVADGVVYFGSDDSNLYALNASTGAFLWSYPTVGGGVASPSVANGVVYVGVSAPDDSLYALSARTGALLWKYTTGEAIESSPAIANGVVYIGSWDYNLYAFNASTGALLWEYPTGSYIVDSSPAVANGVVYVGSSDGKLYAFDLTGGQLSGKFSPPERPQPNLLQPDWKLQPSSPVTSVPSTAQE